MDFAGTVRGHLARAAAVATVAFTLVEAILGALLVKLGLTAQSHSPLRAPYLALHLTNTLAAARRAHPHRAFSQPRTGYSAQQHPAWCAPIGASAVALLVLLIVGVTGSLAALGDTLFPATSLRHRLAQDFAAESSWLVRWRWTHPTVAFLASIFLIWLLVRAAQRSAHWDNRGLSALVLMLLAAQYVLGVLDVVLLAPSVAADRAPAGRGCAVGSARGADSAADPAAEQGTARDQQSLANRLARERLSIPTSYRIPCGPWSPVSLYFYFTNTPAAG